MKAADQLPAAIWLPLLNWRAGTRTGRLLRELTASERWPREELEAFQKDKLVSLLRVAGRDVPFYRNGRLSGISTEGSARDVLGRLPILTRAAIRQAGENMLNPNGKRVQRSRTGGTTGEPLEIWRDRATAAIGEAALWRGKSWAGIRPWDRAVAVKGFGKGGLLGRFRMRLLNKWVVPAFRPGAAERSRAQALIRRVRPAVVEGYVTDLLSLAEGQDFSSAQVRAVLTTGEMLYPDQKEILSAAFSAPVFSYYGCNEISSLAYECERGAKHVVDEHVIMEAVDEAGQAVWDRPGRLLVTDLDNRAMPLIRYELGDVGTLSRGRCGCGRSLLVLQALEGRRQDALRNEAGDRLGATFFAGRFRDLRHLGRFQLVQEDARSVEILHEGEGAPAAAEAKEVAEEIRRRLGDEMQIRIRRVDQIPLTARGKRLLIRGMTGAEP